MSSWTPEQWAEFWSMVKGLSPWFAAAIVGLWLLNKLFEVWKAKAGKGD
jgi:hypothetical protein